MDLAGYLKFLLYNNDSVAIPGIGTLKTRYKHAEINHGEKTISPPSKHLHFESSIDKSDSQLVSYIAKVDDISKKEATSLLKSYTDEFLQKLNSGETVMLDGIGYFLKTGENIRFEKETDKNFYTGSFGLSKVDFVSHEAKTNNEIEIELTPEYSKKTLNRKVILWVIFFLVICIGGMVIFINNPEYFTFIKKQSVMQRSPVAIPEKTEDTAKNDTSGKKTIEEFFESTTDKKNALAMPAKKVVSEPESMKYYIIAGSFKTQNKANELAKEIEKDGFKLKIIKFEETKYRISLGEYTNFDSAMTELERIRNQKGDNTVWMLKVKKD